MTENHIQPDSGGDSTPTVHQSVVFWLVVLIFFAAVVIIFLGYRYQLPWVGVSGAEVAGGVKTFWDWLDLLIIPAALVLATFWFRRYEAGAALKRRQAEAVLAREIESQRAKDAALGAFYDALSVLVLDRGLLEEVHLSPVHVLAQARLVAVLRQLDTRRIAQVFSFLNSLDLLAAVRRPFVVDPETGVESPNPETGPTLMLLSGVDLSGMDLRGLDFSDMGLFGARFVGANLQGAVFNGCFMDFSSFKGADLRGASFFGAHMRLADFSGANLDGVVFANSILSSANLLGARGLSCKQLTKAKDWESAKRDPELACEGELPDPSGVP